MKIYVLASILLAPPVAVSWHGGRQWVGRERSSVGIRTISGTLRASRVAVFFGCHNADILCCLPSLTTLPGVNSGLHQPKSWYRTKMADLRSFYFPFNIYFKISFYFPLCHASRNMLVPAEFRIGFKMLKHLLILPEN